MKEKSEVEIIFKNFYTIVQTQFQKNIQILQSDNGREHFKNMLSQFFLKKELFIKALVLTLCNKMVWLKEKTNTYWK
jgi:hypothetical protein